MPVAVVVVMAQVANAIWFHTAWVYLSALLALVLVAFGLFPRLLAEIWNPNTEA